MKYLPLFIAIFGMALSTFAQSRLYVNHIATGANTGQSWADAYTNLQTALQTAIAGDEVWVAEGTYLPTNSIDRSISFEPASGVRLYGGFAGTEAELTQRDWQAHPVVLSGDIGVAGDSMDNTYNVVYLFEPDSNTVLDGFFICYGNANVSNANSFSRLRSGGGLFIMGEDADAYPEIRNCTFIMNTARSFGGAVMVYGGGDGSVAPRLINCRFEDNRAVGSGGGVARIGGSWLERGNDLEGCVFLRNRAGFRGGGFYYLDSERSDKLDIHGCTFEKNKATDDGGGAFLAVGRVIPSGYSITKTVFQDNEATDGGAFISFANGFLFASYLNIDSCDFINNQFPVNNTLQQQAVAKMEILGVSGAKGQIKNSKFQANNNWPYIAIIEFSDSEILFDNITIKNNNSIQILLNPAASYSKIDVNNSTFIENNFDRAICQNTGDWISYYNCIFCRNNSVEGQYMDNAKVDTVQFKNCTFSHSNIGQENVTGVLHICTIISENSTFSHIKYPDRFFYTDNKAYISNCHFDSSFICSNTWPFIICLNDNILGLDPLFVNPDSGDYRLQPCSPLRDAGNNAFVPAGIPTDLAGAPRIQGGTVDIGAYETPAFGLAAEPSVAAACANQPTGAVTVPLQSACEPLVAQWQSGSQSGAGLGGLAAGQYAFTVTDAQGRSVVFGASIPAAASPTLQADGQPITCFGAADAMLSVMPLSGVAPFSYLWSPSGAPDSVLTGLGPGPVSVTVTDAWGCTATFAFDVPEPDSLYFVATVQDASTTQSSDGSILVNTVLGGTAPYDYLWSPGGSTSANLEGIPAGTYTLTLTDERGCEAVQVFEVKYVLGTDDALSGGMLLLYPNPAGASVTLAADFGSGATPSLLEIYDSGGRLLRRVALSNPGAGVWEVPLEGLAGWYVVVLRDAAGGVLGGGRLVKR